MNQFLASTKFQAGIGGVVSMLILFLWQFTYPYGCTALLFPFVFLLLIGRGQFEYVHHRKIYTANFLFKKESFFHAFLTRKPLVFIYAGAFSFVYAVSLTSFVALAESREWLFLALNTILVVILYPFLLYKCEKHAAVGMASIMAKRLVVFISFTIMVVVYVSISFYSHPPSYLDIESISNTLNIASQSVMSTCSIINLYIKMVQEVTATIWFNMVAHTEMLRYPPLQFLAWAFFFLNSALVFLAMSRMTVELIALCTRIMRRAEETEP